METLLKPFVKFNAIIALILLTINLSLFFDFDGLFLVCVFYVYIPVLLVAAPIAFIYYGHYLAKNYGIPWRNKILISCFIFIVSCVTYAIPSFEWLLGYKSLGEHILLLALTPAVIHTFIFFCSITINQIIQRCRKREVDDTMSTNVSES